MYVSNRDIIKYGDYLTEQLDGKIQYSEYIAENLDSVNKCETSNCNNNIEEGNEKNICYRCQSSIRNEGIDKILKNE